MMKNRARAIVWSVVVAAGFGMWACSDRAEARQQMMKTERVASGLSLPLFVANAPGEPYRLYIVEKGGVIKFLDLRNPAAGTTTFLDISALVTNPTGVNDERGLLGMAFHPQYATNGFLFVYYTNNSGNTQMSRFSRLNGSAGDAGSEMRMLTIVQPQTNHNGGWMAFGPNDGFLYLATGDGGGAGDTGLGHNALFGNGQSTSTLLGKILRFDVDRDDFPADANRNYGIPASNPALPAPPAGEPAALPEIWAWGIRNAWRCSFDRSTGDLYIADVGQNQWEEINFQPASSAGGENYGWRCFEGNAAFNTTNCNLTGAKVSPFLVYGHTISVAPVNSTGNCSITGGYVYRGCALDVSLQGTYFFTDFCSSRIWSVKHSNSAPGYTEFAERTAELAPAAGQGSLVSLASFGEDAFGELYIVRHSTTGGEVHKIVPFAAPADCNANNVADVCEIALGLVPDANRNGIPDTCGPCPGDANTDRAVNFADITAALSNWGSDFSPGTGSGDANGNGVVNFEDITTVLSNWGAGCV